MDKTSDTKPPTEQPQIIYPALLPNRPSDEIDLFELFAAIWRRRVFIGAVTCLSAILSLIYVSFIATPVYEVTARLRQPADSTLVQLRVITPAKTEDGDIINENVFSITKEQALARLESELNSRSLLRRVFTEALEADPKIVSWTGKARGPGLSEDQLFLTSFLPRFSISKPKPLKNQVLSEATLDLTFTTGVPKAGAAILQKTIEMADKTATEIAKAEYFATLNETITRNRGELDRRIASVQDNDILEIARIEEQTVIRREELTNQISAMQTDATQRRLDSMARLGEAITIAKNLGIDDPVDYQDLRTQRFDADSNLNVNLDDQRPLYFRGTKLLRAELQVLKDRSSDDFMSPQIRELQRELATLDYNPQVEALKSRTNYLPFTKGAESLQTQIENLEALIERPLEDVSFLRIDLPPIPPAVPVKPKKKLIVMAATFAGALLSIMVALILNVRDNRRKENEKNKSL